MDMRIGHGFDAHKFTVGDEIVLGGVRIPFAYGIDAHSDGDLVIHAICDALLGAAGLGDIGQYFSDMDDEWADKDSRYFLKDIVSMLDDKGWAIGNVDVTVLAEAPKLAPYKYQMACILCEDLNIPDEKMNIKATTMEGMGYIGQQEGMAAHAVAVIFEKPHS